MPLEAGEVRIHGFRIIVITLPLRDKDKKVLEPPRNHLIGKAEGAWVSRWEQFAGWNEGRVPACVRQDIITSSPSSRFDLRCILRLSRKEGKGNA